MHSRHISFDMMLVLYCVITGNDFYGTLHWCCESCVTYQSKITGKLPLSYRQVTGKIKIDFLQTKLTGNSRVIYA